MSYRLEFTPSSIVDWYDGLVQALGTSLKWGENCYLGLIAWDIEASRKAYVLIKLEATELAQLPPGRPVGSETSEIDAEEFDHRIMQLLQKRPPDRKVLVVQVAGHDEVVVTEQEEDLSDILEFLPVGGVENPLTELAKARWLQDGPST